MLFQMPSIKNERFKSCVGAAIVIAATATGALAADPTPAALQAAQTIVATSGMSQSFDGVVPQMLFELERNTTATRPDIKDKMHETLLALAPEFVKTEAEVAQAAALALASRLSEQELKDTAAFFQSASGKKYVESQPAVFKEVVALVQNWRQKLSTQMLTRAREEMKKKGIEF